MRIFIDTDILLDVLLRREPFFRESASIMDWAEEHPGRAAVSWHSLADIDYLSKDGAEPFIGAFDDKYGFEFNQAFLDITQYPITELLDRFNFFVQQREIDPAEIDDITLVGLEIT